VQPVRISEHSKKTYAQPILRKTTLQQAKIVLSSKIKNIFSPIRSNSPKVISITSKSKKRYQKPGYEKLTPEQIKLILIGQFNLGEESAGDLLDQLFPESKADPNPLEEPGD
jgi:type II restriction/modification system DNA methylase subunit YeeA